MSEPTPRRLPQGGRVVATFEDADAARRGVEVARRAGFDARAGTVVDRRGAVRGEMADELESTVAGPGSVGPFTKSMSKGLVRWPRPGPTADHRRCDRRVRRCHRRVHRRGVRPSRALGRGPAAAPG